MTRLTKLLSVAMVLLFLLFAINVFAFDEGGPRTRIPKVNWGNSMGTLNNETCVQVGDNTLEIKLTLGFARNDLQNFPPLYVGYDWGGYSGGMTEQITSGDLVPAEINGYSAYETTIIFNMDLDGLCSIHNPSQELILFNFSFELITMDEGFNVEPYPVLYEAWPLFPSYIFPETGEIGYTPDYTGQKYLCCQENDAPSSSGTGPAMIALERPIERDHELSGTTSVEVSASTEETSFAFIPGTAKNTAPFTDAFQIFPNPVDQFLNVDLSIDTGNFYRIEIIDLKGAILKSVYREIDISGKYQEQINVSDISSGIYFCRIQSATHNASLKLTIL